MKEEKRCKGTIICWCETHQKRRQECNTEPSAGDCLGDCLGACRRFELWCPFCHNTRNLVEARQIFESPENIEIIAEIEHKQWMKWSKELAEKEGQFLSPTRISRWERYWIPYSNLEEDVKDHDRKWAKIVLQALKKKHGVD